MYHMRLFQEFKVGAIFTSSYCNSWNEGGEPDGGPSVGQTLQMQGLSEAHRPPQALPVSEDDRQSSSQLRPITVKDPRQNQPRGAAWRGPPSRGLPRVLSGSSRLGQQAGEAAPQGSPSEVPPEPGGLP